MNEENRWKWVAISCGGLLLLIVVCCVGAWLGGMIGYSMGKQTAESRWYRPDGIPPCDIMPLVPPTFEVPVPPVEPEMPYHESGLPWLGVIFFMTEEGAQITEVIEDSPAAAVRLHVGDIVTKVDEQYVTTDTPLHELILHYEIGDKVSLNILRNGKERKVRVVLGERPLEPIFPRWPEEDPFLMPPGDG